METMQWEQELRLHAALEQYTQQLSLNMGIRWIPKATVGSANVTTDVNGDGALEIISPTGGIWTIQTAQLEAASGNAGFDLTGQAGMLLKLDGTAALSLSFINNSGTSQFDGSFTALALFLTNFATIPTIPNETASVTVAGTTNSTTFPFQTIIPLTINASGLTPTLLTAIDLSAATTFATTGGGMDAISVTFAGQAITEQQILNSFDRIAFAINAGGVTSGSLNYSGGTMPSVPTPISAGSMIGDVAIATDGDWVLVGNNGQTAYGYYFGAVEPTWPTNVGIVTPVTLGMASGDADLDAAALLAAMTTNQPSWGPSYVSPTFSAAITLTVIRPRTFGGFGAGFVCMAGFSSGFSYTGN